MTCKCAEKNRLYADDFNEGHIIPNDMPCIKIVTDNPDQFQKAHNTDAGYDILASEAVNIRAGDDVLISTGLKVAIPEGYVGILKSRSGLAVKHRLEVGAGVIDCGYTGEIRVLLHNLSFRDYKVTQWDKVAQMVIVPICPLSVKLVGSLEDSKRGNNGFNSTGYK